MSEAPTAVESYIDSQVTPHLAPGELISHRGYFRKSRGPKRDASLIRGMAGGMLGVVAGGPGGLSKMAKNRGYFIALTPQRLFLIETQPGTLGPKLKNNWMGWWSPADILITVDAAGLHLDTRDRKSFVLEINTTTKHSRTQPQLLAALGVQP